MEPVQKPYIRKISITVPFHGHKTTFLCAKQNNRFFVLLKRRLLSSQYARGFCHNTFLAFNRESYLNFISVSVS